MDLARHHTEAILRIPFLPANVMTDDLPTNHDTILVANLIHDFSPDQTAPSWNVSARSPRLGPTCC